MLNLLERVLFVARTLMTHSGIFAGSNGLVLPVVLILAGIELIFFIAASVGLRFGFVTKTALSRAYTELTQSRRFLCSSHHPTSGGAGGARGFGRS